MNHLRFAHRIPNIFTSDMFIDRGLLLRGRQPSSTLCVLCCQVIPISWCFILRLIVKEEGIFVAVATGSPLSIGCELFLLLPVATVVSQTVICIKLWPLQSNASIHSLFLHYLGNLVFIDNDWGVIGFPNYLGIRFYLLLLLLLDEGALLLHAFLLSS